MADETDFSSDTLPSACRFFREVFTDPAHSAHDQDVIKAHMMECVSCRRHIGKMINERAKLPRRTEETGT